MGDLKDILKVLESMENLQTMIEPYHMLSDTFQNRIDNALEETLKTDKRYQEVNDKISLKVTKIEELSLNDHQWKIIDNAMSAYTERGSEYGRVAYFQGFKDALKLLMELSKIVSPVASARKALTPM